MAADEARVSHVFPHVVWWKKKKKKNLNKISHWITYKGWYAIKLNQPILQPQTYMSRQGASSGVLVYELAFSSSRRLVFLSFLSVPLLFFFFCFFSVLDPLFFSFLSLFYFCLSCCVFVFSSFCFSVIVSSYCCFMFVLDAVTASFLPFLSLFPTIKLFIYFLAVQPSALCSVRLLFSFFFFFFFFCLMLFVLFFVFSFFFVGSSLVFFFPFSFPFSCLLLCIYLTKVRTNQVM